MSRELRMRLRLVVEHVFAGNSAAAAKAADMEPSTLHRILNDRVGDPRLTTAQRLADSFGVPVSWLLGEASAEQAQGDKAAVPLPLWLIRSYHDKVQSRARELLRQSQVGDNRMRRLMGELAGLQLFPRDGRASVPALPAIIDVQSPSRKEVTMLRSLAEIETAVLDHAIARLRQRERDGEG